MLTHMLLAATTLAAPATGATAEAARRMPHAALQGPYVELWTDHKEGEVYHRGDQVRVYFRSREDAYVTVFRVDTDGRVRVLFPGDPWEDNFARGGRAYEVRPRSERYAFDIDEYPGEGYLFVIATTDPFDYRNIVRNDHWDYRVIAGGGRITGDPYVALMDFVDLIVPANYNAYSYDLSTYYVERYYDYPRFLCYDCHSYVSYPYWDPYIYSCSRFRIVIYDDPYYYPARAYPATRVVYRTTGRIEARYIFKDRTPSDAYVVRVRQRPSEPPSRRVDDRGGRVADGAGGAAVPTTRQPAGRVPQAPAAPAGMAPGRRPDEPVVPGGRRPESQPGVAPQPGRVPDRQPEGAPAPGRVPDRQPAQPQGGPQRVPTGRVPPATMVRPPAPPGATTTGGRAAPEPTRRGEPEPRPQLEPRQPVSRPPQAPQPRAEPRSPAAKPPVGEQPRAGESPKAKPPAKPPKKPESKPPARKKPGN